MIDALFLCDFDNEMLFLNQDIISFFTMKWKFVLCNVGSKNSL